MPTVQRFYVKHHKGTTGPTDVYEETLILRIGETFKRDRRNSSKVMYHASFVYDRHADGGWEVIKDRVNTDEWVLPSDQDIFMMILSAKSVKECRYDLC
jgi:hypothetical protein